MHSIATCSSTTFISALRARYHPPDHPNDSLHSIGWRAVAEQVGDDICDRQKKASTYAQADCLVGRGIVPTGHMHGAIVSPPPKKTRKKPVRRGPTAPSVTPIDGLEAGVDAIEIVNSAKLQRWLANNVGPHVQVPMAAAFLDHSSFAETVELQAGLGSLVAIGVARITQGAVVCAANNVVEVPHRRIPVGDQAYVQYVPRGASVRGLVWAAVAVVNIPTNMLCAQAATTLAGLPRRSFLTSLTIAAYRTLKERFPPDCCLSTEEGRAYWRRQGRADEQTPSKRAKLVQDTITAPHTLMPAP